MAIFSAQEVRGPRRLRLPIRIGTLVVVCLFVLAWGQAFGSAVFAIVIALFTAWLLWRGEVESGNS